MNRNTPRVSVIIIGYNIEQFLEKCLETICNQTYADYEVIFVSDGSTDRTLSIAEQFREKYGVIVVNKPNGGIVSARKAGLKEAKGEYVSFIDGDDWVNDNMLESLINSVDKSIEKPDIVCSNFNWQTETGDFIIQANRVNIIKGENTSFFEGIMSNDIDHHMFPKLYRKQFILDSGYEEYLNVTMAEDLMTNALLGLNNPIVVYSKDVNYYYRYNTTSVIRKGNEKLLEQIKTLKYLQETIEKANMVDCVHVLMEYQWFSYAMGYLKRSGDFDIKKKIFDESKKHFGVIGSNKYVQRELKETQGRYVRLFFTFYRHEKFAYLHDKMLFTLLNAFKRVRKMVRRIK